MDYSMQYLSVAFAQISFIYQFDRLAISSLIVLLFSIVHIMVPKKMRENG